MKFSEGGTLSLILYGEGAEHDDCEECFLLLPMSMRYHFVKIKVEFRIDG